MGLFLRGRRWLLAFAVKGAKTSIIVAKTKRDIKHDSRKEAQGEKDFFLGLNGTGPEESKGMQGEVGGEGLMSVVGGGSFFWDLFPVFQKLFDAHVGEGVLGQLEHDFVRDSGYVGSHHSRLQGVEGIANRSH